MKTYGGMEIQIHIFFTSAPVTGEWSASHHCFTPVERAPSIYWPGGWVGPESVWTMRVSGKFSPYRDSNSNPSVVAIPTALPTLCHFTYDWEKLNKNAGISIVFPLHPPRLISRDPMGTCTTCG
jgi:hypothetical protein